MPGAEPAAAASRGAPVAEPAFEVVDVVFDVVGASLPDDYAWPLLQAIERRLPWFAQEALTGVHPLRTAPTGYGVALLPQRAKLALRTPGARLADSLALQDTELDVGGASLRVGAGHARALRPAATVAAHRVASEAAEASAFEDEVARALVALGVECRLISGRRRWASAGGREIAGYALTLHGLGAAASLHVQGAGIGGERRLGWGLFVPAKAIVATGE
jgi:CRISPR-associated protein Cas6